jgi:NAD(P) transhydrogenase subunit beta
VGDAPLATLGYLVTSVCFIFGIKRLGSPATARSGNLIAAAGMVVAIVVTVVRLRFASWELVVPSVLVGAVGGAVAARTVRMTAMPQMVALFNGMGGGSAALIGAGDFERLSAQGTIHAADMVPILISSLIGSISFAGSMIAFAKLQELMTGRPITFPLQQAVNGVLLVGLLAIAIGLTVAGQGAAAFVVFIAGSLCLGVLFVLPVGGADMPVIISLLNSLTGLAAAATGFVLANEVLIVAGALVGASGTILTVLMSRAMNRSLANVLFGAFGAAPAAGVAGPAITGNVRAATVEDVAALLAYARLVIIVPGYGLAVARAQHAVKELADELQARGVEVKYAIHPVAGRMPGHMNVLLAEANVPYPQLYEMEQVKHEFSHTDVALVIGANDVVNPAARNDPSSPIYGMPILNVDESAHVVVLKRSMRTGFAGIENALFYDPKTVMLFGDAKSSVTALVAEVKEMVPVTA